MSHPLMMLSSVDGRYAKATAELAKVMGEYGLIRARVIVKIMFIMRLCGYVGLPVRSLTPDEMFILETMMNEFSLEDATVIQKIEREGHQDGDRKLGPTNHDVQAVELWLQMRLRQTSMADLLPWLHFGRTSEDINSLAYAQMLKQAIGKVIGPQLDEIIHSLEELAVTYADLPMLARTHGQSASPTTFGKEMRVFATRLDRAVGDLLSAEIDAKFSGASGNHNAEHVAFPNVDWLLFAQTVIEAFDDDSADSPKIVLNTCTTQIEPHDSYAKLFQTMIRINTILEDFVADMWRYISDGWVTQRTVASESGSSAMPHKVNPIDFENAEGNFGTSIALFEFFARKLPKSRLQRDLTDSTVMRNFGTAFGLSLVGYKSLVRGLGKITPNASAMDKALEAHPEVVTEAIQVILRREGVGGAYDLLKAVARGKPITKEDLVAFIGQLPVSDLVKIELAAITPHSYIGLAPQIARMAS